MMKNKINIYIYTQKENDFYNKFIRTRCLMIIIFCKCDRIDSYQFFYINKLKVFYFI
jgi:hypothetical protein